jgi:hypothetical protein
VAKKLEITVAELQGYMDGENKSYRDYKSRMPLINAMITLKRLIGRQKSIIR